MQRVLLRLHFLERERKEKPVALDLPYPHAPGESDQEYVEESS
jgi:hypothetical protein